MIKEFEEHIGRPARILLKNGGSVEAIILKEEKGQLKLKPRGSQMNCNSSLDTTNINYLYSKPLIIVPVVYNYRTK